MDAQEQGSGSRREPNVGIIVLNWNNWQDTLECLDSIRHLAYPDHRVILIDNGSTNDSVSKILAWCDRNRVSVTRDPGIPGDLGHGANHRFILIETGKNLGFAGGINIGIRVSLELDDAFVWLLNSDTIVDPMALTFLLRSAGSDDRIGMVGSLIDEGETLGDKGRRRAGDGGRRDGETVRFIPGASLLARAACIRDIGLIDEGYFLYGEEVDWCLQARRKGWTLLIDPRSRVGHKWGASTRSKRIRKRRLGRIVTRISWEGFPVPGYYEARNGIYFIRKNHPALLVPYAVLRTTRLLAQILLYDDHKLERWGIILRGALDGVRGRQGMTLDPALPYSRRKQATAGGTR